MSGARGARLVKGGSSDAKWCVFPGCIDRKVRPAAVCDLCLDDGAATSSGAWDVTRFARTSSQEQFDVDSQEHLCGFAMSRQHSPCVARSSSPRNQAGKSAPTTNDRSGFGGHPCSRGRGSEERYFAIINCCLGAFGPDALGSRATNEVLGLVGARYRQYGPRPTVFSAVLESNRQRCGVRPSARA